MEHSAGSIAPLQLGVVVVIVPVVVVVELVVMHASHITGHLVASGSSVIAFLQKSTSSSAQPAGSGMPLQTGVVVVVVLAVVVVVVELDVLEVVVVVVVAVSDVVVVAVVVLVTVVVGHELHRTGQSTFTLSPKIKLKLLVQSPTGISLQAVGSGRPWQVGVVVVVVVVGVVVVDDVVVIVVVVRVLVVTVVEVTVFVVVDEVNTHDPQRTGQLFCNCLLVISLMHKSADCALHKAGSGNPLQTGVVVVEYVVVAVVAVLVVTVVAVAVVVDEVQEPHKTGH